MAIIAIVIAAVVIVPILAVVFLVGVGTYGWQQANRSGNEAAAAQTVDNIRKFQAQYASRNRGTFATFDELIVKAGLDSRFAGESPVVNEYTFRMTITPALAGNPAKYEIWADPNPGSGTKHFYANSALSTIKQNDERPATGQDDPL